MDVEGTKELSSVNHKGLVGDVSVGDKILLADGLVTLNIDAIEGNNIILLFKTVVKSVTVSGWLCQGSA